MFAHPGQIRESAQFGGVAAARGAQIQVFQARRLWQLRLAQSPRQAPGGPYGEFLLDHPAQTVLGRCGST